MEDSKFDKKLREALGHNSLEKTPVIDKIVTDMADQINKNMLNHQRINFIDDVAKLLFMKNRGMYPDSCFERAEELWEARQEFFKEKEVPQKKEPQERVAVQYWEGSTETKTGWIGSGWMFEDAFEPEEEFWFLEEIIDYDKQGNPIKATFKRK